MTNDEILELASQIVSAVETSNDKSKDEKIQAVVPFINNIRSIGVNTGRTQAINYLKDSINTLEANTNR